MSIKVLLGFTGFSIDEDHDELFPSASSSTIEFLSRVISDVTMKSE